VLHPLDGTDMALATSTRRSEQAKNGVRRMLPYPATNGTNRGTCVASELVSASRPRCYHRTVRVEFPLRADREGEGPKREVQILSGAGAVTRVPGRLRGRLAFRLHRARGRKLFLAQGTTCAAGELCAPCTDPTTGNSSGACD